MSTEFFTSQYSYDALQDTLDHLMLFAGYEQAECRTAEFFNANADLSVINIRPDNYPFLTIIQDKFAERPTFSLHGEDPSGWREETYTFKNKKIFCRKSGMEKVDNGTVSSLAGEDHTVSLEEAAEIASRLTSLNLLPKSQYEKRLSRRFKRAASKCLEYFGAAAIDEAQPIHFF